jgi:ATP-dependent DNA helicase RecQ
MRLGKNRHAALRRLLRMVFGIVQLRDGQQQVIENVLDGKDTLAIMPTGAGKSLCYQLPALMLPGAVVVVSPLIALMKDQLGKVEEIGFSAGQLHSAVPRREQLRTLDAIRDKIDDIIFCTPERLVAPEFVDVLRASRISLVVIDEAHCISQWGHDFRPAYLEMAAALDALGRPPILALTATATADVTGDICRQLGAPAMQVINTGIYRANLDYGVRLCTSEAQRNARAVALASRMKGAGIIYCATVKAAIAMHRALVEAGQSVALYHGKLRQAERRAGQDGFMGGQVRLMVATNAFGMGIDKPDIRFLVHLQIPANLEAYYQESGRAGRDGERAACVLLYWPGDKRVQQFFLLDHAPDAAQLKALYATVHSLAGAARAVGLHQVQAAQPLLSLDALRIGLKLLKDGKLLRQNRKLDYVLTGAAAPASLFDDLAGQCQHKREHDRDGLEKMVHYAQSGQCRWDILRRHFGDAGPGMARCGHCDNCRHPPRVQAGLAAAAVVQAPVKQERAPYALGSRVRVPQFEVGVVRAVAGDQVTVEFPDRGTHTFLAGFLAPA